MDELFAQLAARTGRCAPPECLLYAQVNALYVCLACACVLPCDVSSAGPTDVCSDCLHSWQPAPTAPPCRSDSNMVLLMLYMLVWPAAASCRAIWPQLLPAGRVRRAGKQHRPLHSDEVLRSCCSLSSMCMSGPWPSAAIWAALISAELCRACSQDCIADCCPHQRVRIYHASLPLRAV